MQPACIAGRSRRDGERRAVEGEDDILFRVRAPFLLRAGRRRLAVAGTAAATAGVVHVRLGLVRRGPHPERGDGAPAQRAGDGAGDPGHVVGLDHRAQVQRALGAQLVPAHFGCDVTGSFQADRAGVGAAAVQLRRVEKQAAVPCEGERAGERRREVGGGREPGDAQVRLGGQDVLQPLAAPRPGHVQRDPPVAVGGGPVGPARHEDLAAPDLAARGGVVQRRAPGADGRHGGRRAGQRRRGDVGALVHQQVHAVRVPVQRRQVQRRHAAAGRPVHELVPAGAGAGQQQAHARGVASRCRQVQRRLAAQAVHLGHVASENQQRLNHLPVAEPARLHQRRLAGKVPSIHLCSVLQQQRGDLVVAFGGGEVERRVEAAADGGAAREPRVFLQQAAHLRRVAVPRAGRQPLAEPRAPQGVAHAFPPSRLPARARPAAAPADPPTLSRLPAAGQLASW
uniref:Uncharacterized protein n=1 Tax=Zea mays TaxID=4577 RepID=B8A262_MAIZE|nr:unknown [Zea mays]